MIRSIDIFRQISYTMRANNIFCINLYNGVVLVSTGILQS